MVTSRGRTWKLFNKQEKFAMSRIVSSDARLKSYEEIRSGRYEMQDMMGEARHEW